MVASVKAAWGIAGVLAIALTAGGYRYTTQTQSLSEQAAGFKNERNVLKGRLDEAKKATEVSRKKAANSEEQIKKVEIQLDEIKEQFYNVKTKREKDQEEIVRLQATLQDADRSLSEFRNAVTDLTQKVEKLETDNVSATKAVVSLRSENRKLQETLGHFSREIQDLSAASHESKSTRQSLQRRIFGLRKRYEKTVHGKEQEIEQLLASHKLLLERLKSKIDNKEVFVRKEKEHISIEMVNRVTFETGRAELTKSSEETINVIFTSLAPIKDGLIVIEGHADNRRIRGSLLEKFRSNWELSLARAATVVRYLEKKGIDPKRMSVVGYSYFRPIDSNLTISGRSRNRRVEILLVPGVETNEKSASVTKQ